MTFKDLCINKGGVFKKGVGCFLNDDILRSHGQRAEHSLFMMDFPEREHQYPGEGRRLFYQTTKEECEKNGDEMVHFGEDFLTGVQVCRELGPSEYCKKHGYKNRVSTTDGSSQMHWINSYTEELEACMSTMQFPDHKLEQYIDTRGRDFLEVMIIRQKLSSPLINKIINHADNYGVLQTLYGSAYQVLSPENIDAALDKGESLRVLFEGKHKFTQGNLTKAIRVLTKTMNTKELSVLYNNYTLDEKNIDLALSVNQQLRALFETQELSKKQITVAMQGTHGVELEALYQYQSLTPTQVEDAIKKAKHKGQISGLCKNKKIVFTSKQIDEILGLEWDSFSDKQQDLNALYGRYVLTPKQVDRALALDVALEALVMKSTLTDAQITRIINTCEGEELYQLYSKKGALNSKHVDLALASNHHYIPMLYQYQTMTQKQIAKAIKLGINREAIYEHQTLGPEQVQLALEDELKEHENDLQKKKLFANQTFSNAHVSYIIEQVKKDSDSNTLNLFMERQKDRLNNQHMKSVINYAKKAGESYQHGETEVIDTLFSSQHPNADIIDYCIKQQVSLESVYENYGGTFEKRNIDTAIKVGKHVGTLYLAAKLSDKQISDALKQKQEIQSLIRSEKSVFNSGHVLFLIQNGSKEDLEELFKNYSRGNNKKRLTEKHISEAIERGDGLRELYQNNALYQNQLKKAMSKGKELRSLYCNNANNFSKDDLKWAIIHKKDIANLYTCQQNLPPDIIDIAMEEGLNLHELYEHQKLNYNQIMTALQMNVEIQQLIDNHLSEFKPAHFSLLIPIADDTMLFRLYKDETLNLSDEQREILSKTLKDRLGFDVPPSSIVHATLDHNLWMEFELKKKRSVDARIPENPFTHIIGVYPLSLKNPWQEIIDFADEKGYRLSDDGKYMIKKTDPKVMVRTGKLLMRQYKSETHPMMRDFKKNTSQSIRPMHYTDATMTIPKDELENLEVVISNDPNDIAAKATGHVHLRNRCEQVYTGAFGWKEWTKAQLEGREPPPSNGGCGWCDDIKNNNVIAYLRTKEEWMKDSNGAYVLNKNGDRRRMPPSQRWFDRAMVRWCIREDDKKPDAILEVIYGGEPACDCHKENPGIKYKPLFEKVVTDILRANGFTAKQDGHKCVTPYPYTGYADKAEESAAPSRSKNHTITYKLADRPSVNM